MALRPAHWLCQQMTHFVQAYCTFTTTEVLEQRWHGMDAAIRGAKTIDEVVALHDRFLDAAMKGCLLVDIKVGCLPARAETCMALRIPKLPARCPVLCCKLSSPLTHTPGPMARPAKVSVSPPLSYLYIYL